MFVEHSRILEVTTPIQLVYRSCKWIIRRWPSLGNFYGSTATTIVFQLSRKLLSCTCVSMIVRVIVLVRHRYSLSISRLQHSFIIRLRLLLPIRLWPLIALILWLSLRILIRSVEFIRIRWICCCLFVFFSLHSLHYLPLLRRWRRPDHRMVSFRDSTNYRYNFSFDKSIHVGFFGHVQQSRCHWHLLERLPELCTMYHYLYQFNYRTKDETIIVSILKDPRLDHKHSKLK